MEFSVGDSVFYPMHGVGMVEKIEENNVLGKDIKYYFITFLSPKMTVMIPVETAEGIGLRPVIGTEDYDRVIAYLLEDSVDSSSSNWNQRNRDNMDKLKTGDVFNIAYVVKSLKHRGSEKGLSSGERKMLLTARQVLLSELICVSGKCEADFESIV